MNTNPCFTSNCHNCRFFQPDGNYHGTCGRLHAPMLGKWPACQLALPKFESLAQSPAVEIFADRVLATIN
ncbi:hypothetical protein [Chamaesiphon sp. OTE_75_metabat_556]|uniref:hypothetical protein n=1 Tax=Chamaesiphon sp. OTE_75_metabat_556 TaxID=2964692 RepID=UPI00286C2C24|nr:hypothetical protein [Chamaesiphon sp. OTE_75_metabat_556]